MGSKAEKEEGRDIKNRSRRSTARNWQTSKSQQLKTNPDEQYQRTHSPHKQNQDNRNREAVEKNKVRQHQQPKKTTSTPARLPSALGRRKGRRKGRKSGNRCQWRKMMKKKTKKKTKRNPQREPGQTRQFHTQTERKTKTIDRK